MRIRTIKPEWLEDELLASLPDADRVLSVALILLSDDYGNGRANEHFLATRVWFSGESRESLRKLHESLGRLQEIGFVRIYVHKKQQYFHINNWNKHQKVSHPGKPLVPPPEDSGESPESLLPDRDHDRDHDRDRDPIPREGGSETELPFDNGLLADRYDRISRETGHGPYKRKHSEYQALQDAFEDLLAIAKDEGETVAKVAETSIRNFFNCREEFLVNAGYPFKVWAKKVYHYYRPPGQDDAPQMSEEEKTERNRETELAALKGQLKREQDLNQGQSPVAKSLKKKIQALEGAI